MKGDIFFTCLTVLLREVSVDIERLFQVLLGLLHLVPAAPDDTQLIQRRYPALSKDK
jgi:hypothetical protein